LAVEAGDNGYGLDDVFFWQGEDFAEIVVEADGDVASDLDVLFLVCADGDKVTVVNEDVGRLEDGVCEQAMIRAESLGDFVFVACAPLQKSHWGYTGKQPGQFGNLGHIGLAPEDGFFGVEAQSNVIYCDIKNSPGDVGGVRIAGEGVVVGDEIETIVLGLKLKLAAHSTEEIANMKPTRRLYARKNSQIDLLIKNEK